MTPSIRLIAAYRRLSGARVGHRRGAAEDISYLLLLSMTPLSVGKPG
ncbi:MAG: hypothetical protein ABIR27_04105 [Dokdonella sp.]